MPTPESPTSSQFVAGVDVNNYRRTFRTDENGDMLIASATGGTDTVDAADGSIGAPVPLIGIQIAGKDPSGNLVQPKFDSGGNLLVSGLGGSTSIDQGNPNTLANGWPVEITDGTNVLGTASHPLHTTSGAGGITYSTYHKVSAGSNNAANIKNAAGTFYGITIGSAAAYQVFVKIYDKATTPAPASDTPLRTFACQAGIQFNFLADNGIALANGLGIAILKGIADTDNTAVLASDCVVDLLYA